MYQQAHRAGEDENTRVQSDFERGTVVYFIKPPIFWDFYHLQRLAQNNNIWLGTCYSQGVLNEVAVKVVVMTVKHCGSWASESRQGRMVRE